MNQVFPLNSLFHRVPTLCISFWSSSQSVLAFHPARFFCLSWRCRRCLYSMRFVTIRQSCLGSSLLFAFFFHSMAFVFFSSSFFFGFLCSFDLKCGGISMIWRTTGEGERTEQKRNDCFDALNILVVAYFVRNLVHARYLHALWMHITCTIHLHGSWYEMFNVYLYQGNSVPMMQMRDKTSSIIPS